jgi:hypothetical protein
MPEVGWSLKYTMYHNRLIVLGGRRTLRTFQNSDWLAAVRGRYAEPLEFAPTRFVCQFETPENPLPALRRLSRSHPGLLFLLDYETDRLKGLAKAKAGRLTHHQIRF